MKIFKKTILQQYVIREPTCISISRPIGEVSPLLFDISLFQSQVPEDNADKGRKSEVRRDIDIRSYFIAVEMKYFEKFCLFLLSDVRYYKAIRENHKHK